MRQLAFCLLLATAFNFFSCKKDYRCMCPDPLVCDDPGFVIHDTKSQATKTCKDTKNPYNDSKCIIY